MVEENARKKEIDEDESFFNSILPHVKTFDPRTKMKFRIKVLELVHNLMPTTSNTNEQSATGPHLAELTIRQNLPPTSNENSSQSIDHNQQEPSQNQYYDFMYPNNQFIG